MLVIQVLTIENYFFPNKKPLFKTHYPLLYISVSQLVGHGPLVDHGALQVGRRTFFILLKMRNFIKIILKNQPFQLQKHQTTKK